MKSIFKKVITKGAAACIGIILCAGNTAFAEVMSSGNYSMEIDSANAGGGLSSSGSYALESTAGETATGRSSSGSFAQNAGFQQSSTSSPPDIIAPTVPTGLAAQGLSVSSIGLVWNASSDAVGVTAYGIFRDGTHIATTSLASYTDTGLAASTTYSYTVVAADAAGNVSAQSASASASTLAPTPAPAPGSSSSSSGSVVILIYDILANAGSDFIDLAWSTNRESSAVLRWGLTESFEGGSIVLNESGLAHRGRISGLVPGQEYFIRIEAVGQEGLRGSAETRARTLEGADRTPPANVAGFTAEADGGSIALSWRNPNDLDFDSVRIVRSEEYYPSGISDGDVIYEGDGEAHLDRDVREGVVYYYAAFAKDAAGNYSSGAAASAMVGGEAPNPFDNLPDAPAVDPKIGSLTLADFRFIQDEEESMLVGDNALLVDGMRNLKIVLDYDRVPEVLKTIAITFVHPFDQSKQFTFLLRANEDKSAYEAVIGPLEEAGVYGVRIAVVDHKNRGLKKIEGNLMATVSGSLSDEAGGGISAALLIGVMKIAALILLLIALAIAVLAALKRRSRRKLEAISK